MIRGSLSTRATTCYLDEDGTWTVSPADTFLAWWLNVDCSPHQFGPADGDPEIAAIERAQSVLGGTMSLPEPLPGPGPGTIY